MIQEEITFDIHNTKKDVVHEKLVHSEETGHPEEIVFSRSSAILFPKTVGAYWARLFLKI